MTLKNEIQETKERIAGLETRVAEVKAGTAAALHRVNVQARYASRVQSVIRSTPSDPFVAAMRGLIDAYTAVDTVRDK